MININKNGSAIVIEGIIYKYTSPSNKVYIGLTIDERQRRYRFLNMNLNYAGGAIDRARAKYGPNNFKYEILERHLYSSEAEAKEDLNRLEIYYIGLYNSYNNGYNLTIGGESISGYHHSEETKLKISIANKGKISYNTILAAKEANTGRKQSKELIEKKSKLILLIDKVTNEVIAEWASIKDAANALHIDASHICKVCKGKKQSSGGYKWLYK